MRWRSVVSNVLLVGLDGWCLRIVRLCPALANLVIRRRQKRRPLIRHIEDLVRAAVEDYRLGAVIERAQLTAHTKALLVKVTAALLRVVVSTWRSLLFLRHVTITAP